jgi:hypothetical protein
MDAKRLRVGDIEMAHEIVPDAAHSPQLENRGVGLAAIRAHLRRARA